MSGLLLVIDVSHRKAVRVLHNKAALQAVRPIKRLTPGSVATGIESAEHGPQLGPVSPVSTRLPGRSGATGCRYRLMQKSALEFETERIGRNSDNAATAYRTSAGRD